MRRESRFSHTRRRDRREGIALLVVMVAFVLLYLVVFQLQFTTGMEEKIAQVRYGEVESYLALHSAGLFVMTHLVEDLVSGSSQASSTQGGGQTGGLQSSTSRGGGAGGAGGGFTSLSGSAGTASKTYDYLNKNIFNDNQQQVGNISVRIRVVDGERAFNLNMLFDYPRMEDEELSAEGQSDLREEDLAEAAGKSAEAAESSLRSQILARRNEKKSSATSKRSGTSTAGEGDPATGTLGEDGAETVASEEYDLEEEFVPPDDLQLDATRRMVERAVLMMFSINENAYGYRYGVKYSASEIADAIVRYVLERRTSPGQNRIFLVTELLNIPEITREVFYGPTPEIKLGEEIAVGNGYILRRDEYGDVVPQYQAYLDDPSRESDQRVLEDLMGQFGRHADLGGFGLGRLQANPLTRGMEEKPVEYDEYGNEIVVEEPRAIGLKDIFTAFSTGKINLNTASVPVIYGLLLTLSDAEAEKVALDIRDYRNRFQEYADEEGVDDVSTGTSPDLGQPKRARPVEEDAATSGSSTEGTGNVTDQVLADAGLEGYESSYQELETNYFTSLEQLELVDGSDEGPQDQLRRDEGVQMVSAENDTLYRRTIHDLEKVAVFGSTYFTAELKAKPSEGRGVRTGYLTVCRDTKKKRMEVVLWKNLQK